MADSGRPRRTTTDHDFARAFAPLLEVQQRGAVRAATPDDVLEILSAGGRRYVVKKTDGIYMKDGGGWTPSQRKALTMEDIADARWIRKKALTDYGVRLIIVRIRRRGTAGLEWVRLRPDIDVKTQGDLLSIHVGDPEAMALAAALLGAKAETGEQ